LIASSWKTRRNWHFKSTAPSWHTQDIGTGTNSIFVW